MIHRCFLALLFSVALIAPAIAAEIAGVQFEEKTSLGGTELVLNGAGLRKKMLFKVYAMGLYLPARSDSPNAVLSSKGPKRIQIVTLRDLSAEQLAEALQKGVEENLSADELAKVKSRLEEFRANLLAMGKVPERSNIRIEWTGTATRVHLNTSEKGKEIAGEDFYAALLKIWLGEKPAQGDLKDALLGKTR